MASSKSQLIISLSQYNKTSCVSIFVGTFTWTSSAHIASTSKSHSRLYQIYYWYDKTKCFHFVGEFNFYFIQYFYQHETVNKYFCVALRIGLCEWAMGSTLAAESKRNGSFVWVEMVGYCKGMRRLFSAAWLWWRANFSANRKYRNWTRMAEHYSTLVGKVISDTYLAFIRK